MAPITTSLLCSYCTNDRTIQPILTSEGTFLHRGIDIEAYIIWIFVETSYLVQVTTVLNSSEMCFQHQKHTCIRLCILVCVLRIKELLPSEKEFYPAFALNKEWLTTIKGILHLGLALGLIHLDSPRSLKSIPFWVSFTRLRTNFVESVTTNSEMAFTSPAGRTNQ